MSEYKELEQKYGELKDKYDEILQLQRQQTSLITRIAEQIEKVIKEMREGH